MCPEEPEGLHRDTETGPDNPSLHPSDPLTYKTGSRSGFICTKILRDRTGRWETGRKRLR